MLDLIEGRIHAIQKLGQVSPEIMFLDISELFIIDHPEIVCGNLHFIDFCLFGLTIYRDSLTFQIEKFGRCTMFGLCVCEFLQFLNLIYMENSNNFCRMNQRNSRFLGSFSSPPFQGFLSPF